MKFQTSHFSFIVPVTSLASAAVLAWGIAACSSSSSSQGAAADAATDSAPVTTEDGAVGTVDSGAPSSDGGLTVSAACSSYAQARCARLDACSNTTYTALHYGSAATCVANVTASCVSALSAAQTAATPESFASCGAAITAEACTDLFGANPPAACATLAGPLALGAACFGGSQCASTYCAVPANASCGTCAAVPQAGDPCTITAECGSRGNLTCDKDGACVAYGGAAGKCGKDGVCGPGFSCVGYDATKGTEGACAAAGSAVGVACDPSQATGAGCDSDLGLACDAVTKTCEMATLVAANAACGEVDDGGVARCDTSGTCVLPLVDAGPQADAAAPVATSKTGACLAAAANGAACDSVNGPTCVPAAKCVSEDGGTTGTCEVVNPTTCN